MRYSDYFERATGHRPYPYQQRLVDEDWPDVVDIPTGLGKTAALTLAWLYRRRELNDAGMPTRLVWCLPMRVLVEQTVTNARSWLERLDLLGEPGEPSSVAVHTLMGGEPDLRRASWTAQPEQDAILVGTQDMLLSRALMRGYGMSRYQWPVHYALLHNDSLWVFDEVQLMGPALATSTQLEAFRRDLDVAAPARSTWVSATLREDWLDTVDFRAHRRAGLHRVGLDDSDHAQSPVSRRVAATKSLVRSKTGLDGSNRSAVDKYIETLASEIAAAHVPGEQTLVILNRVERAQALYEALADVDAERLLLHARFRPAERRAIEAALHDAPSARGRIVIATQAVEAGVDLDSRVLFTELAPWASMVQRFGRCNRAGRFEDARVHWIDFDEDAGDLALPYEPGSLSHAREQLEGAASAAPADLPPVTEAPRPSQVLRRRDLVELFNTDPDLSGFDVDISCYIRDVDVPPIQVFWRDVDDDDSAVSEPVASSDELCNASVAQLREHFGKKLPAKQQRAVGRESRLAWTLDPLGGAQRTGAWKRIRTNELRPGQTVMLAATDGGYDRHRGFVPGIASPVEALVEEGATQPEGDGTDTLSHIGRRIPLNTHLADVAGAMAELADAMEVAELDRTVMETAARWHDVGKAHEAFQRGIGFDPEHDADGPWAKSDRPGRPDYHRLTREGEREERPGFRHELASALAWLQSGGKDLEPKERDRVAFLIAAHHGRVRLGLRAMPDEKEPPEAATLYARGVWAGDSLPALDFDGIHLEPVSLQLDLMRLGTGPEGPSWSERMQRLLAQQGPFRLAWQEALVRIADWRASHRETQGDA